jgi:molybdopterin-guanine dinucleotide biosynthesis protein A
MVGGDRVIDRVAAALRATTDDLLLVANDPAADAWLPAARRVADVRPGRGPLSGIHAALTHSAGSVLVVAWDMPFVAAPLLAELRRRGRDGHAAVVPESADGRLEPACAFYASACRVEIARWLDSGRSAAAAFVEQYTAAHRMPVAEIARFGNPARLFFSINTAVDLKRAELLATDSRTMESSRQ